MNNSRGRQAEAPSYSSDSENESSGFIYRLRDGGLSRIYRGRDMYISVLVLAVLCLVYAFVTPRVVEPEFVGNATRFSIALVAFVLASVSLLISFSDKRFLKLLEDLGIYNTILFNFEFTLYVSIITSIVGIIVQSYQQLFQSANIYYILFLIFVFLFTYMTLATANLVSLVISIGKRKAKFLLKVDE